MRKNNSKRLRYRGKGPVAMAMLLGDRITAQLVDAAARENVSTHACPQCQSQGHTPDAQYCKHLAAPLDSG